MIPSPLTLNQQPIVPRLNTRIYWVGGIGFSLICLAMWSSLAKKTEPGPAPEPMTLAKREMPDMLRQDPPAPQPMITPTPQPMMQQQPTYRPAPPRMATPKPPPQPKQESEKEKRYKEALAASPLAARADGGAPQTLELASQQKQSPFTLDGTLQAIPSPYVLLAGSVIVAHLQTGIESALEGALFAVVSSDVRDSLTQSRIVLPMGARLQGIYSKEVEQGQARVLAVWQRVIYPDGRSLLLGEMNITDTSGYTGIEGKVNNHFWESFGRSLLYSTIATGTSLGQSGFRGSSVFDTVSPGDVASRELSRELGSEARRIARRGEEMRPTITVLPGERVAVLVTKDIAFQSAWSPVESQTDEFQDEQ